MSRFWRIAPLMVVGMVWGGLLLGDDKKEPIVVTARLPTYYSRLNLSVKQKNDILRIRGKYAAQIQELKQKISDLMDQEKGEYEKVLTSAQKERLKDMLGNPNRRKGVDDEDPPPPPAQQKKTAETKK